MTRAAGAARCARPPPGRGEVCEEPARRGSGPAAAGDAPALAAEDFVTCGPAAANLRAPPRAEDAPGRRAPASRPRRRLPLPPPESRAASVGGAAGLQAGLSARWAEERPRRLGAATSRGRRRPDPVRAAWQLRPGRGRGGRGRARSGARGSGGGMWMLAVALLHSISHGERCRPPPRGSFPFPAAGRGAGRGCRLLCCGRRAGCRRPRGEGGIAPRPPKLAAPAK